MNLIRQNYLSIIIGVLVVIVAASFLITPSKNSEGERQSILDKILQRGEETGTPDETSAGSYIVKEGDHLWAIAEERYGSGYNWVDIAEANNLSNPDGIEIGMELILPDVAAKAATTGSTMEAPAATDQVSITGDSYVVVKGDHLWGIAVAAYGDGYQWPKIAKANNVKNPNWIETGMTLKLPRE